jgi:hypothetical protein
MQPDDILSVRSSAGPTRPPAHMTYDVSHDHSPSSNPFTPAYSLAT